MSSTFAPAELYQPEFDVSWTRHSLHSLATWINGKAFRDTDFTSAGTPVVKIAEVKNGVSGQTRFTQSSYDDKYFLRNGDLLFCWSGQPETSIDTYRWRGGAGWLNQHIFKVLPKSDLVEKDFFFQLLRYLRPTFVRIARNKQTTGLGHVTKGDLERLEVALPSPSAQTVIAATLGAFDEKIESNRRLVRLVPPLVRAKVDAALRNSSDEVAVAELASFVNGGAYTKNATGAGRMVVRIADLNSGPSRSTIYNDIEVPDNRTVRPGDILMSWSGSLGVYRWALDEAIVNQHIFKVIPKSYPAWLVSDRLDAVIHLFQSVARDKATTMGHIQRSHLETTWVEVPSAEALATLDKQLGPLWRRLLATEQETLRLTKLRDCLLPELVSGRIRVTEPSETAEVGA